MYTNKYLDDFKEAVIVVLIFESYFKITLRGRVWYDNIHCWEKFKILMITYNKLFL